MSVTYIYEECDFDKLRGENHVVPAIQIAEISFECVKCTDPLCALAAEIPGPSVGGLECSLAWMSIRIVL